ncbi:MAG: hypothetical protein N2510_07695, partial [Ignavibacteria bacterium]|nr:hypothetical protein [Ignavibacteria bacterium]
MLEKLCCPVNRKELELITFENFLKAYEGIQVEECRNGVLLSPCGWMYPVINGIPRMQLDAFLTYSDFLKMHYNEFSKRKGILTDKYYKIIKDSVKKTKKTKKISQLGKVPEIDLLVEEE